MEQAERTPSDAESPHCDTKAWYIVQIKQANSSEWWDLVAQFPVGYSDVWTHIQFIKEQLEKDDGSDYRLIIRSEMLVTTSEI